MHETYIQRHEPPPHMLFLSLLIIIILVHIHVVHRLSAPHNLFKIFGLQFL